MLDGLRSAPHGTAVQQREVPRLGALRGRADAAGPVRSIDLLRRLPSPASRKLVHDLEAIAVDPTEPVLVVGPRGAGKSLVARAVHELSPRARRPFVKLDLAHVTGDLAASDLFGHVRGAYTGAISDRRGAFADAHTGTLFLDELLKAPQDVQQRLLNAIEYGEVRRVGSDRMESVDVRVVMATNVEGAEAAQDTRMLPDLFGRVRSFQLRISPLCERRRDIPLLIEDALAEASRTLRPGTPPALESAVAELLAQHDWPDNVRELYSSVRRLVLEARGAPRITLDHCHPGLAFAAPLQGRRKRRRDPMEIQEAIRRSDGNMRLAASLAGVSLSTVYRHDQRRLGGA